jgi:hypothetical protein
MKWRCHYYTILYCTSAAAVPADRFIVQLIAAWLCAYCCSAVLPCEVSQRAAERVAAERATAARVAAERVAVAHYWATAERAAEWVATVGGRVEWTVTERIIMQGERRRRGRRQSMR